MTFSAFSISLGLFLFAWTPVQSQEKPAIREIAIRAFVHDPVNPPTGPWMFRHPEGIGGDGTEVVFGESLTEPLAVKVVDNRLHLFRGPKELMASTTVAPNLRRGIVVIVPTADPAAKIPYRMVTLDDAPAAFPFGTSKAISLVGVETMVQAGSQRTLLRPGGITPVPEVRRLDQFNMAQTDFFAKGENGWAPITERRLQYLPDVRRIWIIYTTPGSKRPPMVRTLVDNKSAALAPMSGKTPATDQPAPAEPRKASPD